MPRLKECKIEEVAGMTEQEVFEKMSKEKETILKGEDAFKLYDTYGFPLELTKEYAEEKGFTIDEDGFNEEMQSQRNRARAARQVDDSFSIQSTVLLDIVVPSDFVGFNQTRSKSELAVIISDDEMKELVTEGNTAQLIFRQTPFYAEMGGQVADQGVIKNTEGELVAKVTDVKRAPNGQNLHLVDIYQELRVNEEYILEVDELRRRNITKNHTATHLLHQALKDVLGDHANQAGSLVAPNHLRFDFTHFGQVTAKELMEMEKIVNQKI